MATIKSTSFATSLLSSVLVGIAVNDSMLKDLQKVIEDRLSKTYATGIQQGRLQGKKLAGPVSDATLTDEQIEALKAEAFAAGVASTVKVPGKRGWVAGKSRLTEEEKASRQAEKDRLKAEKALLGRKERSDKGQARKIWSAEELAAIEYRNALRACGMLKRGRPRMTHSLIIAPAHKVVPANLIAS